MRPAIILIYLGWLSSFSAYAQSNLIRFDSLTVDEGFPAATVLSFLRDSRGFMWFGTQDGLVRYDGVNYRVFYPDKQDSSGLYQSHVFHLYEDRRGRIWLSAGVGPHAGKTVQVFDPVTEKFSRMPFTPVLNSYWYNQLNAQHYFLEDKDSIIWVKCFRRGLYKIEETSPDQFLVTNYRITSNFPQDASADSVSVLFMDSRNTFWVGTRNGLYQFDRAAEKFTRFPYDPNQEPGQITGLVEDRQGNLWINYEQKGLYQYNPATNKFAEKWPEPNLTPAWYNARYLVLDSADNLWMLRQQDGTYLPYSLDRYHIPTGETDRYFTFESERVTGWHFFHHLDREGFIWASVTYQGGIHRYHPRTQSFELVNEFSPGSVHNFYFDRYQNVWVSKWYSGIKTFHPSQQKFDFLFPEPLRGKQAIEASDGNILIAPRDGGIIRYTLNDAREVVKQKYILRGEVFGGLIQGQQGRLWAVSFHQQTRSLISIDLESNEVKRLALPNNLDIRSVAEVPDRGIMVGSRDHGLFYYEFETDEIIQFVHNPDDSSSLSSNIHNRTVVDNQQRVWVHNGTGFHQFNAKTKNFTRYDPGGIMEKFENVYRVQVHHDSQFWVGSVRGLSLYEPRSGRVLKNYLVKDGFPTKDINLIISDDRGNLWLGTRFGLVYFNPITEEFTTYDTSDGLPDNYVQAGFKRTNGELVFGTTQGTIIFHPDELSFNQQATRPVFTEFRLFNEPAKIGQGILTRSISYTDKLVLNHDQNVLSFTYSALSLVSPGKNQYAYFMEGIDPDWNYVGNQAYANYAGLPPGEYVLHLKASNNDGVWSEPTSLQLTILSPWWQTWWAYVLYALLAVGAILTLRHYEMKRFQLRQRAEHLAELDTLKTHFFANISHEFRTPLTLIKGPLEKFLANPSLNDADRSVYQMMQRNVLRLLRLVNQLLDLSKLEADKMQLLASPNDLVELLRQITASYESLAQHKSIKYFFYPEMPELIAYIDPAKIEKIVHNLLSNAFKFTSEGGEVILYLKEQEAQAAISVKDTGPGIPADELDKVFDRFYQVDSSLTRTHEGSGLGMALAKELVDLHQGCISVESKKGQGTTFTVKLPLGQSHRSSAEIRHSEGEETFSDYRIDQPSDTIIASAKEKTDPVAVNDNPLILIVEDNEDMRHYISHTLREEYQTREAENGKVGHQLASELLPDLIISDVMMPEMDGYTLCQQLKTDELTSHIPIILLTAKADRQSKLSGLQTGADDYLAKPFDREELLLIIRNRIDERRKMREHFSRHITLGPTPVTITPPDEQFLQRVMQIVENHLDDTDFGVDSFSQEAGMSRAQLFRKMKALTDHSPSDFIRVMRLKRAAQLLNQGSCNVAEVAFQVGFNEPSYFSKCFQKQYGQKPSEYVTS